MSANNRNLCFLLTPPFPSLNALSPLFCFCLVCSIFNAQFFFHVFHEPFHRSLLYSSPFAPLEFCHGPLISNLTLYCELDCYIFLISLLYILIVNCCTCISFISLVKSREGRSGVINVFFGPVSLNTGIHGA